ncbi:MAG: prepilin-type N-terminal cleavage/methylation domain-containing protein [Rickettsiales bacterium]|nr:prepilin-type N-terminal cleavage/methylation domain-containing protein [Rickettsiales bacterium]
MKKNKSGFTIIELSIVLVIIGLLVGAVLGGQEIIESSKRLSVISNFADYKSAYDQFKDKYYGMPGDLVDAASYWPSKAVGGDGNSSISQAEGLDAWQHLSLAGYVDGTFSGMASGTSSKVLLDTDIPAAPFNNSGYTIQTRNTKITNNVASVMFGRYNSGSDYNSAVISPQGATNIDQKIDNNNPSQGQIITTSGNGVSVANCVTAGASDPLDSYNLSNKNQDCILIYYLEQVVD